jgi:hypothetical protein
VTLQIALGNEHQSEPVTGLLLIPLFLIVLGYGSCQEFFKNGGALTEIKFTSKFKF